MQLHELLVPSQDSHFEQRRRERVDQADISFPSAMFSPDDDKKLITQLLTKEIKSRINENIKNLIQAEADEDPSKDYITLVAQITVKKDGRIYRPVIKARSYQGSGYLVFSNNNRLITIELVEIPVDVAKTVSDHVRNRQREGKDITQQNVEYRKAPSFVIHIEVEKLLDKHLTTKKPAKQLEPEDLPYKVRGDYRNSTATQDSYFIHDLYGKGKIISSDPGGMTSTGTWDEIVVEFPNRPQPMRFTNLRTKTYFRRTAAESVDKLIGILEHLTRSKVILR